MKRLFFVTLILILLLPHPGLAAGTFNKNFILSDEEFFNTNGMTLSEIQHFLDERSSALASYVVTDVDGALRTTAEVIWRTANTFKINPKFLLVLLQKEQGLVEAKHLTQYQLDWATGFARCDSCSQDHPDIQDKKGLAAQIVSAAIQISERYVADLAASGKTKGGFGPGIVKKVDRTIAVKPANKVTAILYTYTPHIAGNKQLWAIWNKWFSPIYPDGSLLQDKKTGGVWLIEDGSRRPFSSKESLKSRYDINLVIQVDSADLDRYPVGQPIKFGNYTMLKGPNGKLYLVAGTSRREVVSTEVMRKIGFLPAELISAPAQDIAALTEGAPITAGTVLPLGKLFQDAKTGGVFFVVDGIRHAIIDKQILNLYFKGRVITKATETELNAFTKGEAIGFRNGEIVGLKKTGQVYVISNGLRRPTTKNVLQALNYDTTQIVWTSEKLLALHQEAEPIAFTTTSPEALAALNTSGSTEDITTANDTSSVTGATLVSDDDTVIGTDNNEINPNTP